MLCSSKFMFIRFLHSYCTIMLMIRTGTVNKMLRGFLLLMFLWKLLHLWARCSSFRHRRLYSLSSHSSSFSISRSDAPNEKAGLPPLSIPLSWCCWYLDASCQNVPCSITSGVHPINASYGEILHVLVVQSQACALNQQSSHTIQFEVSH